MTSLIERLLQRETSLKILSLVLALSLWLYVTSEQNPEATQVVPLVEVVPRNVPEDLAIVIMDPARVSVTVGGRPSRLDNFDPTSVAAVVDLADAEAGILARVVKIQLPDGIHLVDVSPSEVVIALEVLAEKDMPVEVSLEGTVPGQFTIGQPVVFPEEVRLAGAESKVAEVARVVSGIDIEGISESMVFEGVRVFAVDGAGRQVTGVVVAPETVRVTVPVNVAAGSSLSVEPVLTGEPKAGFEVRQVTVEPERVPVLGPESMIVAAAALATEPIDVGGRQDTFTVDAALVFPATVTPAVADAIVKVTIHMGPSN